MDTLDQAKDMRTVASVSAIIAVGVSWKIFNDKITQLENDVSEIQTHLATIIPNADPNTKSQLEQVIQAIKLLDNRIVQTQKNVQNLSGASDLYSKAPVYRRLTPSSKSSSNLHKNSKRSTYSEESSSDSEEDYYNQTSSSDEDDIAAMME